MIIPVIGQVGSYNERLNLYVGQIDSLEWMLFLRWISIVSVSIAKDVKQMSMDWADEVKGGDLVFHEIESVYNATSF